MEERKETLEEIELLHEENADEMSEETEVSYPNHEDVLDETPNSTVPVLSKHESAIQLVSEAKEIVRKTDEQMQQCRLLLTDDLKKYEEAKAALYAKSLKHTEALIEQIGKVPTEEGEDHSFVVFEAKDEIEPMSVQDISSGRFTGVLLALIGGIATLAALILFAADKLGIALGLENPPSFETMHKIASWYALPFTGMEDFNFGSTVMAVATVAVFALIYFIRVMLKSRTNYHFATTQLEAAERYKELKGDCKIEMDKVDAHMNECIDALNLYSVLLNEKNGTLERILYLENGKMLLELHPNSRKEVEQTEQLLGTIYTLMQTPMSQEGKLSASSTLALRRTKEKADELIGMFYR